MMDRELVRHFAERAATFDQASWVRDPRVMSAALEFIAPRPGQRILDVGAGTGAVLEAVLAACPQVSECTALDISPEMLSRLRDPRITPCVHDAQELPFSDASFDTVICRQTLHYIDDVDRCLGEIHRVLRADGVLVVGQMTPFGSEDEAYWRAIVHQRQPLRRHDLTQPELVEVVARNGFGVACSAQIPVRESLNSWLARYEGSDRQLTEVRRLHLDAPADYQRLHRFEYRDGDVLLVNCWTFLRAIKTASPDRRSALS